ncbi:MAG: cyclic-di-AMP receptor, partial [Bellilinea sp.]
MKLIIAIVRDTDSDQVSHALTTASFRVTGVASSGGFLRKGKT